jgi:hypothetical protein
VETPELKLKVAHLGDAPGVLQRLGYVPEKLGHLLGASPIEHRHLCRT